MEKTDKITILYKDMIDNWPDSCPLFLNWPFNMHFQIHPSFPDHVEIRLTNDASKKTFFPSVKIHSSTNSCVPPC